MTYIIGIDVGGTNTNGVLLRNGLIEEIAKAPTEEHDLSAGAMKVLSELIRYILKRKTDAKIEFHLSTTLATNAVVTGKGDPVAAIVSGAPGICLEDLELPFPLYQVGGVIDHRGREILSPNKERISEALLEMKRSNIRAVAGIGKFSPRNPTHELLIEEMANKEFAEATSVTLGHRLSGRLNFPRRIVTSLLNAKVTGVQREFAGMMMKVLARYRMGDRIHILKADGGTMRLKESMLRPVETILSGPAAAVMGVLALSASEETVILDIGGTTTEIAILVGGEPLHEKDGAEISGYKTTVPALLTRSIGLGGDSKVTLEEGELMIGPQREGPPVLLGGERVTPTDAVAVLKGAPFGDRERARQALAKLGGENGLTVKELAEQIVALFCQKVASAVNEVYLYLNSRPVYTVSEVLAPRDLKPVKITGMGGPAEFYIPRIAEEMNLDYEVLPYHESVNAIGAAASIPTAAVTFHADTVLGKMIVPELDLIAEIPHPFLFDLERARTAAKESLYQRIAPAGEDGVPLMIEITEEEAFNVVRGFHRVGRIFSLKAQARPKAIKVKTR